MLFSITHPSISKKSSIGNSSWTTITSSLKWLLRFFLQRTPQDALSATAAETFLTYKIYHIIHTFYLKSLIKVNRLRVFLQVIQSLKYFILFLLRHIYLLYIMYRFKFSINAKKKIMFYNDLKLRKKKMFRIN